MNLPQSKATLAFVTAVLALAACSRPDSGAFPGYAEGEYVRIASPYAGSLATLSVKRGDQLVAGGALFALEQENERASREEAAARVRQAESQLENLRKGKRPEEVAAVRAQLAQADASLKLSNAELKRTEDLVASKFLSPSKLDEARSAQERDRSRVAELGAQLKVVQLAGRSDEIAALQSEVKAAREQLAQAEWRLAQKTQRAPRAALVADTLYTQGEWVQAGMPVVSLLPPENIKLKFFVPEKQLSALKIGQDVQVTCDGCTPLTAKVSYVSPQAEYTSPLIYSKENRATLVFLIEARAKPDDAIKLHPGQPVEVRL
jgi:HlyD family secretion protein